MPSDCFKLIFFTYIFRWNIRIWISFSAG